MWAQVMVRLLMMMTWSGAIIKKSCCNFLLYSHHFHLWENFLAQVIFMKSVCHDVIIHVNNLR